MKENLNRYPNDLVKNLKSRYRKVQTTINVLELCDYIFARINTNKENRWVSVPYETLKSILGTNYNTILTQIDDLITRSNSYSTINHQAKELTFSSSFINYFKNVDWKEFVWYVKSIESNKIKNTNITMKNEKNKKNKKQPNIKKSNVENPKPLNFNFNLNSNLNSISYNSFNSLNSNSFFNSSNSSNIPPIISHTFVSDDLTNTKTTYHIDLQKVVKISEELFDPKNYKTQTGQIAAIQTAKKCLGDILTDNIKISHSDKTGRYYTSITQLQKELRECLIKDGSVFCGEIDLKCSHAMIILSKFKLNMTSHEYIDTFNFLSDINLWDNLMQWTGITNKADVKDKFQLFMNGSYNQNRGNKIYDIMKSKCPKYTELLFNYKQYKTENISNEVSRIEASIMHSVEVKDFMLKNNIKYDVIHDCIFVYGDVGEEILIKVAQYIINQFKSQLNIAVVFTLEINHIKTIIKDLSIVMNENTNKPTQSETQSNNKTIKPMIVTDEPIKEGESMEDVFDRVCAAYGI